MAEKQVIRVLEAVRQGCSDLYDCSEFTRLPKKTCSAHLSELAAMGFLSRKEKPREGKWPGAKPFFYEIADA